MNILPKVLTIKYVLKKNMFSFFHIVSKLTSNCIFTSLTDQLYKRIAAQIWTAKNQSCYKDVFLSAILSMVTMGIIKIAQKKLLIP